MPFAAAKSSFLFNHIMTFIIWTILTLGGTLPGDQVLTYGIVLSPGSLLSLEGRDLILDNTYLDYISLCSVYEKHSILSLGIFLPFPVVSSLEKRKLLSRRIVGREILPRQLFI